MGELGHVREHHAVVTFGSGETVMYKTERPTVSGGQIAKFIDNNPGLEGITRKVIVYILTELGIDVGQ